MGVWVFGWVARCRPCGGATTAAARRSCAVAWQHTRWTPAPAYESAQAAAAATAAATAAARRTVAAAVAAAAAVVVVALRR